MFRLMRIFYGVDNLKKLKNPVVALGVFDGVHRAHIRILRSAVRQAAQIKGQSAVLTFWPHPQKEPSLYSLKHRLNLIAGQGIDTAFVLDLNKGLSEFSADKFVKTILVNKLGVRYVFVGENFRFGKFAHGNVAVLKKLADLYHFKLRAFSIIKINHKPVSSSYIRRLISSGNFKKAAYVLSRPVGILGTVIRGVSLGRQLGFPTANINPHHEILPPPGIYSVKVILNKKVMHGICYIGSRPTFKTKNKSTLDKSDSVEVYIFDFSKNIYGKDIEINFVEKIRNEKKFISKEALIKQIEKDISCARRHLSAA